MGRPARLVFLILILRLAISAGSAAAAAAPVASPGPVGQAESAIWHSECVDCPKSVFEIGDRSLALDSAGFPHVAYAGDALYYARFDGMAWHVETIDSAPGIDDVYPSPASLALDAAGAPHVSYLNAASSALKYARRTPQGWQIQTVDSLPAGQVFNYDTALALDSTGRPHIAYFKNGQLWYAAWTGSAWRVQLVDATQKAEFHVSLAVDAANQPHISYGVWRGPAGLYLKYAQRAGGAWTSEVVEDGFLGEYNAIALDSHGAPYISYLDYAHSQLKVAHRTPAGWQIEVIDGVQWFGGFTSIAVDSQDRPHITYAGPPVGVRYARWMGAAWQLETVGSAGWFTSLALDPAGQPHMVYFDTAAHSLAYARRDAAGWSLQVVDRLADAGSFNALAVDAAGVPAAAYYESGHGDLRVARQFGSQWQVETVDGGGVHGDVGQYPDIALDGAGRPFVSYYDATNGDLKLARQAAGAWLVETVDSGAGGVSVDSDVGRYTSLVVDTSGNGAVGVLISYYDATHGDLKLAQQIDGRWRTEVVDEAGDVGRYTSLALDADGRPWIAYYDATRHDLKVAHRTDGGWLAETVDEGDGIAGDVGADLSLAVDAAGAPHISYYDATHGDLKYAVRLDGQWRVITVDAVDAVGRHSALALDPAGQPRISYTAADHGALRYAAWSDGEWSITELRRGWQVAGATALVLEASGRARISFYDPGWRHLRLVTGSPFGVYLPIICR